MTEKENKKTGYVRGINVPEGWTNTREASVGMDVDLEKNVTLMRAREILKLAEKKTGQKYDAIKIIAWEGTKVFNYNSKTNTLTIWENGLPIYENANGKVTTDRDALADSLM